MPLKSHLQPFQTHIIFKVIFNLNTILVAMIPTLLFYLRKIFYSTLRTHCYFKGTVESVQVLAQSSWLCSEIIRGISDGFTFSFAILNCGQQAELVSLVFIGYCFIFCRFFFFFLHAATIF